MISLYTPACVAVSYDGSYKEIAVNRECDEGKIELTFGHSDYALEERHNATFLLSLYGFTTPFIFQVWLLFSS